MKPSDISGEPSLATWRDQALKREARLRDLFREIDADGSGRIDFAELRHALVEMERRKLAPHRCPHQCINQNVATCLAIDATRTRLTG